MSYDESKEFLMPNPHKGETRSEFVQRFMTSKEAQRSFPNEKQRLAVAYSEWARRHKEEK